MTVVIPRKGHVTKRHAPEGYQAITKPLARQLYETGTPITLCGNNVNAFHVFGGWHLGCTLIHDAMRDEDFDDLVLRYTINNLDNELGTYAVYYVKKGHI